MFRLNDSVFQARQNYEQFKTFLNHTLPSQYFKGLLN